MRIQVCDVETTGVDSQAKIIEIGQVELDSDLNIVAERETLIDPEIPIPPNISGITGITDEDVRDAPTLTEFLGCMAEGWFEGNTVFVAHNAQFDERFLGSLFENLKYTLCTLRLSRKLYPDLPNHQLATLKYALDLPRHEGHRALNDVLVTVDLLRRIVTDSGKPIEELIEFAAKPIRVEKMPFGKHKGAPLASLPPSYRNWLLNKCDNLDPDLRWSLQNSQL